MNRNITLPLSGLKFKNKKELEAYSKTIASYTPNIPIEEDHPNYTFLCDLIRRRSPDVMPVVFLFANTNYCDSKYDIDASNIRKNEKYRPHYKLAQDTSWVTFSLKKVAHEKVTSEKQKLIEAFRDEIEYQISDFRTKNHMCVCGADTKLEVDHKEPSFAKLIDVFQENKEINLTTEKKGIHYVLCNEITKKLWRTYHSEKATLQMLCLKCHIEKTKNTTMPPKCVDITAVFAELTVS